jgi:hypothetical protein
LGADIVIAVDPGSEVLGRRFRAPPASEAPAGAVQLDFHRVKEAIKEGHRTVERVAHNLAALKDGSFVNVTM